MSNMENESRHAADVLGDAYLSAAQVAAALGLRTATIYTWVRRYGIPFVRLGRLIRIPRTSLMALLAETGLQSSTESQPCADQLHSDRDISHS